MKSLRDTVRELADAVVPLYDRREAESIARMVVTDLGGMSLSQLVAHADEPCCIADLDRIKEELAAGRPVQYVLGHCEFCGLDFEVGEGVLIPRPETEELVETVARRTTPQPRILDLCTGSGCIAVALAARVAGSRVSAVDISAEALGYARRNAAKAGVNVEFYEADVLGRLDMFGDGKFDAIVSNPPYIPVSDMAAMHTNVIDHEPHEALFVADAEPLIFHEAAADHAQRMLRDGGLLCMEIYEHFAERTAAMLRGRGFRDVETIEDANLKPRIVCSRK